MKSLDSIKIINENKKELKDLSKDTENNAYLTESKCKVVDFDHVKTCYANAINLSEECLMSVDALAVIDGNITLIEFKNGKVKNSIVKNKMKDSLLLLCDILSTTISETREKIDFILVYNQKNMPVKDKNIIQESESRDKIYKHIFDKAGEEFVRFDLKKYINIFFREIHTYNEEEFKEYLINHNLYIV